jgi:hypothetical protein
MNINSIAYFFPFVTALGISAGLGTYYRLRSRMYHNENTCKPYPKSS